MNFVRADSLCLDPLRAVLGGATDLIPATREAMDPYFRYSAAELSTARAKVDMDRVRGSLFVIPQNDGEALRIQQVLAAVDAPHVLKADANSRAGVGLADFPKELPAGIREVVLVENPGPELETHIRSLGLEVRIIDHHVWGDLDRYNALSSLEQLMDLIGWTPTRVDRAIALNDRSFVGGMRAAGYSDEEMRLVRIFDLQAQGNYVGRLRGEIEAVQKLLPRLERVANHVVFDGTAEHLPNPGLLFQEIALNPETANMGLVDFGSGHIKISSKIDVVKKFRDFPWSDFGYPPGAIRTTQGGDEQGSMYIYFGVLKKPEGGDRKIPSAVRDRVLAMIRGEAAP